MKKIFVVLLAILALFMAQIAGAVTVTESGDTIEVSAIGSDFTYSASCKMYGPDGEGARMDWIMFLPGKAWAAGTLGASITVKDGTDSGPVIYYSQACDLGSDWVPIPVYFHGSRLKPVIDFSDSSVGTDNAKVIFKLWPQQ